MWLLVVAINREAHIEVVSYMEILCQGISEMPAIAGLYASFSD